jgi:hypothetical protein
MAIILEDKDRIKLSAKSFISQVYDLLARNRISRRFAIAIMVPISAERTMVCQS